MRTQRRPKVTVVGAGFVGSTLAHWIVTRGCADVSLIDVQSDLAKGKALDLLQATAVGRFDVSVQGGNDYALCEGSDVVVVTAGLPRKPGMSRDDLLRKNAGIVSEVAQEVKTRAPDAVVIVVSNPLDAMCHVFLDKSGFPKERVLGMAGILDTARYKTFIAEATGTSIQDIQALVLGGHGDTMVPLSRFTTIGGVPLSQFLNEDIIHAIEQRTRDGGAEIVGLLKTGSAYYAPSICVYEMVESIIFDQRRVLPVSVLCNGEYGVDNLFVGLPIELGKEGLRRIIELDLTDDEKEKLNVSKEAVSQLVGALRSMKLIA